MLKSTVNKLLKINVYREIIIFTSKEVYSAVNLSALLIEAGFSIYYYHDIEEFRINYEENIKSDEGEKAIVVQNELYVPYDIRKKYHEVKLDPSTLFPNFHSSALIKYKDDWDLISYATQLTYTNFHTAKSSEDFFIGTVFSLGSIESYIEYKLMILKDICTKASTYLDWMSIAKLKSKLQFYGAKVGKNIDLTFVDEFFEIFINKSYSNISAEINYETPPILTKMLPTIHNHKNEKTALIVMDGMSLFDFQVLSRHLNSFSYSFECTFALIPTMTSISRQSLLSGKYPIELLNPFTLVNENKEFFNLTETLGFTKKQAGMFRGYDLFLSPFQRFISVIINDVDDFVHGQRNGILGMYNDMNLLGKSGRIQKLIKQLMDNGFAVYMTSDHGNTLCRGVGGFRVGVEVETRSKRMAILHDFSELHPLLQENSVEYPGYYLSKEYKYFICKSGVSFDRKNDEVMTHGGMSLDEVIVPFIKFGQKEDN